MRVLKIGSLIKWRTTIWSTLLLTSFLFFGCKKFVEVSPPKTELIKTTIFTDNATANATVMALYHQIVSSNGYFGGGEQSAMCLGGFASDELLSISSENHNQFNENNLISTNTIISAVWGDAYSLIYKANSIIEGLSQSAGVNEKLRNTLEGEARFIRAFVYFYLYNSFGAVPYTETTDYQFNSVLTRLEISLIIESVIKDLEEADMLLPDDFSHSFDERTRLTSWAAKALLARIYLSTGNWEKAYSYSSQIIEYSDIFTLVSVTDVFLKNNSEAIWQLKPVNPGQNTVEGSVLIFDVSPSFATIRDTLYQSFASSDLRRNTWISVVSNQTGTWYCPSKYKIKFGDDLLNEYSVVLRLAEQYLIRSEARVHLGDLEGSVADINAIRIRAGLDQITLSNESDILEEIFNQRRFELFVEWGHRGFDLKRSGTISSILGLLKPGWTLNDTIFPLPQTEVLINKNLLQNEGY